MIKSRIVFAWGLATILYLVGSMLAFSEPSPQRALHLDWSGPIGPAASDYIQRGLRHAPVQGAKLVLLTLNTEGGLSQSIREIEQAILAAPLPVATFVAPSGASAMRAGTQLLYASHIAAMAPATYVGARPSEAAFMVGALHNVDVADQFDTTVAHLQALAKLRGRNEGSVAVVLSPGARMSAQQALQQGVIDLIANDQYDLLRSIDGRAVRIGAQLHTLNTQDMALIEYASDWRARLLAVLTDPNIAYVLLLLGLYGLFFELANPGLILPAVVGSVCIVVAVFALQALSMSYAGLALLLLGIGLMVAEVFITSFGILGLAGLVTFVFGSINLLDSTQQGMAISMLLIGSFALVSAGLFIGLGGVFRRLRRSVPVTGKDQMLREKGYALLDFQGTGRIHIRGEQWQASSAVPIKKNQAVKVVAMAGLVLQIEPDEENK